MVRRFIVICICIIILATGCNNRNEVANQADVMNDSLIEIRSKLEENNIDFDYEEVSDESIIIPGKRKIFRIEDEMIIVYQFESGKEAKDFTYQFDIGGCTIGNNYISWAGYPHFFYKGDSIIEYVGANDEIVEILNSLFGEEFSGYNRVNK